jgi:hypothetical protein
MAYQLTNPERETVIIIPATDSPVLISTDIGAIRGWLRKVSFATESEPGCFAIPKSKVRSLKFLFSATDRPGYEKRSYNYKPHEVDKNE